MIVAGGVKGLKTGSHTRVMGTIGDLYLTVADEIMDASLGRFPTAARRMTEILG